MCTAGRTAGKWKVRYTDPRRVCAADRAAGKWRVRYRLYLTAEMFACDEYTQYGFQNR